MSQRRCLILGGARSGKSRFAVALASQMGERVLFIATAQPLDEEMRQRIQEHRHSRPGHWRTLEVPLGVGPTLARELGQEKVVVIDCLSLLVSNLLGPRYIGARPEAIDVPQAQKSVTSEIGQLVQAMDNLEANFITVSNEVGLGLVPDNRLGRVYRDLLGWANQQLAERATEVYLMVAGLPWKLKG